MTESTPLEKLAATWAVGSRRATIAAAADRADAQGDRHGADELRALLPSYPAVSALQALEAGHEMFRFLTAGWPLALDAAIAEGATWADIGAATGRSAHRAQTDHQRCRGPAVVEAAPNSPPAHGRWLDSRQVAARVHRSPSTVRRAAESSLLHGHQPVDRYGRPIPNSRWSFATEAVDAWTQGLDEHAQLTACGCPKLQAVPGRRRTGRGA